MLGIMMVWSVFTAIAESLIFKQEIFPILGCKISYKEVNDQSLQFEKCESYSTTENYSFGSWLQCADSCCKLGLNSEPIFSKTALQKCIISNKTQEQKFVLRITLLAFGSALGTLASILCIRYCLKNWLRPSRISQASNNQSLSMKIKDVLQWSAITQGPSQNSMRQKNLIEGECSICLEGEVNLSTSCRHNFHYKCLKKWYKQSKDCPLCKQHLGQQHNIYCKCRKSLATIHLSNFSLQQIEDFDYTCHQCLTLQESIVRQEPTLRNLSIFPTSQCPKEQSNEDFSSYLRYQ